MVFSSIGTYERQETEMYRELRQSPDVRKPKPLTLMDHQTKQKR